MTTLRMIFSTPRVPLLLGVIALIVGWANIYDSPIEGVHAIRQADTLFAGWSYCMEEAEFLRPRIAHRGETTGVSIGEFPLASMAFALPCKLSGVWSESAVKTVVLALLLLNAFLWGSFLRRRWPDRWPGWDWFLLLWIFNTHHLLHFTIAIPDPLAFALIASSGLAFLAAKEFRGPYLGGILCRLAGTILFVIAFGMRPYLVPLLFLVIPGLRWRLGALAGCAVFYFVWYKWWILQSEIVYYATEATAFTETARKLGPIALALAEELFRNIFNFVGLWWALLAFRRIRDREMAALLIGSFLLVLLLRAPMIINHKYYLGAGAVMLTIWMLWGAKNAKPALAWAFLAVGLINTQHYWHGTNAAKMHRVQAEAATVDMAPADKVAVYIGDALPVTYLYWLKRTGWGFHAGDFQGLDHCPSGAAWALTEENGTPKLRHCR